MDQFSYEIIIESTITILEIIQEKEVEIMFICTTFPRCLICLVNSLISSLMRAL